MSGMQKTIIALVALVLAGGGYFYYMQAEEKAEVQRRAQFAAQVKERQALKEAQMQQEAEEKQALLLVVLNQEFEQFLNSFVQDIAGKVKKYKQSRMVMKGLIEPEGLRTAQFVSQNHELGEATILSLRLQVDDIMTAFDEAEEHFQFNFQEFPADKQQEINKGWKDVKEAQQKRYAAYFASDQDVLTAIQDLLTFYKDNPYVFDIDFRANTITFRDKQKNAQHQKLLGRYKALKSLQDEVFGSEEKESGAADKSLEEKDFLGL